MSRAILPTTQEGDSKLFKKIFDKHVADGLGSILLPFFAEEGIVILTIQDNNIAADSKFTLFDAKRKESEKMHQVILNDLNPIFANHKDCVQGAKKFYRSTPTKLGDFGVTLSGNVVKYPTDRGDLCDAIMFFINHNASLAAGLRPISAAFQTENKMNLAANLAALPGIKTANDLYVVAVKAKETLHGAMVVEWTPVKAFNRAVANFLMGQFPLNPKKCGDWGITVDDSPQSAKELKKKFKKGATNVLYDVHVGSILQNTGDSIIQLTKGKAGTGTPIVLNPGDFWKVLTGYYDIKAQSMGILLTGEITYLKNA